MMAEWTYRVIGEDMSALKKLLVAAIVVAASFGSLSSAEAATPKTSTGIKCTIVGNAKANVLKGTIKRDVICGLGGNDIIKGLGGNDIVDGGD
jgi:Ca2+-binding RTX toxin-like protein